MSPDVTGELASLRAVDGHDTVRHTRDSEDQLLGESGVRTSLHSLVAKDGNLTRGLDYHQGQAKCNMTQRYDRTDLGRSQANTDGPMDQMRSTLSCYQGQTQNAEDQVATPVKPREQTKSMC